MGFSFPIHGGNAPSPQPRGLLWGSNHKLQVCSLLWHSEGLWFNPSCPISPSGDVPLSLSPCRREELPQPPHPTDSQSPFSPLLLPPGSPRSPPHLPQLSSPSTRAVPAPPPILSPVSLPADTHGVSELLQGHVHPGHPA